MLDPLSPWITRAEVVSALTGGLIILFLEPILKPLRAAFWKNAAIPPHRIRLLILKGQLSSALEEVAVVREIATNLPYMVLNCLTCLFQLVLSVLAFLLSVGLAELQRSLAAQSHGRSWAGAIFGLGLVACAIISEICLFWSWRDYRQIADATVRPEKALKKLDAKVARISQRIEARTKRAEIPGETG